MKLGIFDEVNKITKDGGLTAPHAANEVFFDENSTFGKFIGMLEKLIIKFISWWEDGTRQLKRTVTEVKMKFGKMFGIEPINIGVPALFVNLCVDDGRISATFFKSSFARFLEQFKNAGYVGYTGNYDASRPHDLSNRVRGEVTNAKEDLARMQATFDKLAEGPGQNIEVSGDDIRQLDKILDQLVKVDVKSRTENIDFVGAFKKTYETAVAKVGEIEANEILGYIVTGQKELIGIMSETSRMMVQVMGTITRVSEKLASSNPSMEDFDVANLEPLQIDDNPSNQLFKDLGTISNEAMMMGNISKYFGRKVDSLSVSIQEGFKYLTTYNYDPMETLHPSQLATFTSSLDFLEHGDLKVSQPNGLKGEILPLTAMLVDHAKIMQKVLTEVIRPATTRFGHYLSVPFDRAERRDFEFGIQIAADREKLVADESKLFTGNRAAATTLDKVFNSFSDFVEAERNMQTVNELVHGGTATEDVKKAVNALSTTASALIRRMSEERNITNSNEFAKMVSDQLAEVGRWVEWYAAQMTRIIETNNVLFEIEKEILKL